MLRATIFLCSLAIFALCAPVSNDEKSDLRQVMSSLKPLTNEEKELLMEMFSNHKDGETSDDFLRNLKDKSPSIYNQFLEVRTIFEERYNMLDERAKVFVRSVFAKTIPILKAVSIGDHKSVLGMMKKVRSDYENLSEGSRASLEKHLPIIDPAAFPMLDKLDAKQLE